MKKLFTSLVMSVGFLLLSGSMAHASSVVYNNISSPTPSNVPSVGFEATSTFEWGNQIQLTGTDRFNPKVTVLMSSWGCESGTWNALNCITTTGATFTHPITLNIYNVNPDNSVGSLIETKTDTFAMPFRPSADNVNCTDANAGKWFDGTKCVNGKAFEILFDLPGVTLPDKMIATIAYNTSHYGLEPIGTATCSAQPQGCPYDSLNVGAFTDLTVGSALPTVNDTYMTSTWGGAYCDNGVAGTGTLRLDAGCWTGYLPSFKVEATTPVLDEDNDGVMDDADYCPGTVTDEDTWRDEVGTNRWQYMNGDKGWGWYQTVNVRRGKDKQVYGYNISFTNGCSGQQILDLFDGHKQGHHKFGISGGILKDFHKDLLDGVFDSRYLLETIVVPSDKSTPTVGTKVLSKHEDYLIRAKGTWTNSLNVADAEYASIDGWVTRMDGYNISPWMLGTSEFDLMVDGKFVNWGPFRLSHTYTREYDGKNAPVKLMVFDGDSTIPAVNSGWYSDNSGNLSVEVFQPIDY